MRQALLRLILRPAIYSVDEGFNVSEGKGKALKLLRVVRMCRYVVRHYHCAVVNFIENFHHFIHIYIAFIKINFLEADTADNGFYLGEHGLAGKWFPHEESIRVPLIVFDPRAEHKMRGLTIEQMVLNIDIAPTILELAGLPAPSQMQGKSLVGLLAGEKQRWRTDFFYEHLFEHKTIPKSEAVRTQRFKYARYIDYSYEELYDLKNDPHEIVNLAQDKKYRQTLKSLRKRCDKLAQIAKGT